MGNNDMNSDGLNTASGSSDRSQKDIDYDALMQANLTRVFGERDPARRLSAIRSLYAESAILHEPQASVQRTAAETSRASVMLVSRSR